jgi:hypothetical protein
MSAAVCPVEVWAGERKRPCGKPVKRDGLCGVHARAADHRKERDAKVDADAVLRKEAEEVATALTDALDLSFGHTWSGMVYFDVPTARTLLARVTVQP